MPITEDVYKSLGFEPPKFVENEYGIKIYLGTKGNDDWRDSLVYSADVFYYVPLGKYPSLFEANYKDINEIVNEFKSKVGKYMPEGYDYRANIRHIIGTTFG